MPTLLTRDEIVIELSMSKHDDGVMDDEAACDHMIDHRYEGSSTNVSSSSSYHHAGRGVLALIQATMTSRKSIALLITMVMTIKWSGSIHDDSAMSDGRSRHYLEIVHLKDIHLTSITY